MVRFTPLRLVLVATFTFFICAVRATSDVFSSQHLYDWGWYGFFPVNNFVSYKGSPAPRLNFLQWDERCMNGYYLFTPKGRMVEKGGPMIMDGKGNLVWSGHQQFGVAADLQSQTYKSKQYLTFWKDLEGISMGWGRGQHYMVDENYNVFRTFRAHGEGFLSDLHEFHITKDDTALLTAYTARTWDLSSIGGPKEGWLMDSVFQEIDIETGELLFEWRASDSIPLEDTIRYYAGRDTGYTPEKGFDYFHINSMDKDKDGNYVVSGRHTQTVHCISPNGTLLWTLGGKQNEFKDLSDGRAIDFTYQHHIRIDDNDVLTMFDNAKAERDGPATPYDYSRGLVIQLDQEARTAKLLHEVYDPAAGKHADSQGSAQLWDEGRAMMVDYGFFPAFTEFDTETSEVLCDVHFGPWAIFHLGFVNSYRAFKGDWVGKPTKRPDVFFDPSDGLLHVSWNGDTETEKWLLQGAEWEAAEEGPWIDIDIKDKNGYFETTFDIESSMPAYLRVASLDKNGDTLIHSQKLSRDMGNVPPMDVLGVVLGWLKWLANVVFVCAFLLLWDYCRPLRSRIWRVVVKMWQVAQPRLSRWCCCCLPKKTKSWLSGRTRWGRKRGKPHELQPLYTSDDEDV